MFTIFNWAPMTFEAMNVILEKECKTGDFRDVLGPRRFFEWIDKEGLQIFASKYGMSMFRARVIRPQCYERLGANETQAEENFCTLAKAIKEDEEVYKSFKQELSDVCSKFEKHLTDNSIYKDFCELLSGCYPAEKGETVLKGSFELAEALIMTRDTLGPDVHDYWYIFQYNPITFYFWILLGMINFCKRFDIHTTFIDSIK